MLNSPLTVKRTLSDGRKLTVGTLAGSNSSEVKYHQDFQTHSQN
ncbi:hypothetical protein SAMN02745781_03481 [Vibrio gazogenes DSM 21264]|uniref:Uncharacterized protein n=1 Tax=Vibrio gazogenes DSM 21264 = NBRC 103151 TaxID=1123492 RepID=A0A1M5FI55_VIBGA|nr:hypothetical protein SAMN02745781_03481 [Vibrio gazogenes DSM 21264] [Vibrio gazogenes DSM 21264 = NBRC 103151]